MVCVLALDPRFKEFASHMISGGDDIVWTLVKDMAIQHWKFECDEIVVDDGAGTAPASKRARGQSGSLMDRFFAARGEAAGDSRSETIQNKKDKLDAAIHQYKQLPVLEEREDPLQFWRGWDMPGSALAPLLPLAASEAAVPATEAICEQLFKAGGQVLTSARLRLLGERVESLLMCSYNLRKFRGIHGVEADGAGGRGGGA